MIRNNLIALLCCMLAVSIAAADTIIPGGYVSGTWTAVGSPYLVQGNITIHGDSTLTIAPGVTVNFQGLYTFTVNGHLEAVGTEADSIHLTTSTFWMGLNFTNAPDSSRLTFCTISHSGIMSIAGMGGITCTSSNPVITHCRISDNYAHPEIPTCAGGIALNNSNAEISWCDIRNNESGMCGGGLTITNCSPVITGCNISGNETVMYGGGIYITGNSSPMITNCTIEANTSNTYGGGISVAGGVITITECTIGYNRAYDGGGGLSISGGSVSLDHCTFEHSNCWVMSGHGGGIFINGGTLTVDQSTFFADYIMNELNGMEIYTGGSAAVAISNSIIFGDYYLVTLESSILPSLTYNDFYIDPIYPQAYFYGNAPPGLGALTQINANGDSCDVYHNIYLNPLFVDTWNDDLHLTEASPCIDAGDPASPWDPDSTITDMGRYYYDQSPTLPPVSVTLTPINPPIVIPATGGSFQFDATVANNTASPATFQSWIKVQLPNGSWYGPVLGPITLTLPANQSATRQRTQTVPMSAPAGLYTYRGWVGTYPSSPMDSVSFTFTKSATGNLTPGFSDWTCSGEPFPGEEFPPLLRGDRGDLVVASPNPFNPTTALSFQLSANSHVNVKIYDTAGRLVTTLVEGWRQAGEHQVTFDGSGLASGIYLARLAADGNTAVQKMVLLK